MARKERNKLAKDKSINMMEPLQLDKLGGPEDVCFGKHHSLKAPECKVCGDAEICSIVCAQKMHVTRKEIEAKTPFKDNQNITCSWKDVSKACKVILKKQLNSMPIPDLKTKVCKKLGIHESEFDKHFAKACRINHKYKVYNNTVKYKP